MHWSNIIKSKVHTKYKGIFSTQRIKRCYQKDFTSKLIKILNVQIGFQPTKKQRELSQFYKPIDKSVRIK